MQALDHLRLDALPVSDLVFRQFACRVVSELARSAGIHSGRAEESFLDMLMAATRSGDPAMLSQVHDEMRRRRISAEQVTDIYFPCVIEAIGNAWHNAELNILEATVALSRLQVLLREFGHAWLSDRAANGGTGCVLLILPPGEQHCLGAMLAANQLRRLGVSVRVELLADAGAIRDLMSRKRFNAVFLSVSNHDAIATSAGLVKCIRDAAGRRMPVVIGGGIVARDAPASRMQRIANMTGADLATSDVRVAVDFCGLQKLRLAAE